MEVMPLILEDEEIEIIKNYIKKRNLDFSVFAKEIIFEKIKEDLKKEESGKKSSEEEKGENIGEEPISFEMWENTDI